MSAPGADAAPPPGSAWARYPSWDAQANAPGPIHVRHVRPDGSKRFIWPTGTTIAGLLYFPTGAPPDPATTPQLVVEGEKTADAVAAAGFPAAAIVSGASSTPGPAVIGLLARYDGITLWPDRDDVGLKLMERIATALERAGLAHCRWVDPPAELAEHGDAADLPPERVREAITGAREIAMLPEAHQAHEPAPRPNGAAGPPEPIWDGIGADDREAAGPDGQDAVGTEPAPWPEPPDDAAYHGPLGEVVRAVAPHTEADPVGVLGTLIAMVGACLGPCRYIYQGSAQAPNLFVVLVGDSGTGRKGTSASLAREVLSRAYPGWAELIVAGLGSGEGLVAYLKKRAAAGEPRALVMESELGRLLTVMTREGSTLSPMLRDAWDGVPMGRVLARDQDIVPVKRMLMLDGVDLHPSSWRGATTARRAAWTVSVVRVVPSARAASRRSSLSRSRVVCVLVIVPSW